MSGMEGLQQICLACFLLIPVEERTCPHCGADLAALSAMDYREKLVHALLHPLADVRIRAIIALGWRGETETANALLECALQYPMDVVQGLEIINSLRRMHETSIARTTLSTLKVSHPAHAVREGAARALAALANQGESHA